MTISRGIIYAIVRTLTSELVNEYDSVQVLVEKF